MVDTDRVGEMMHEDHFVYWAGKKKNLAMGEAEAKVLFKKLSKMPDAMTDLDGPHEDRPMRIWVETKKLVVFRTRVEKAKQYDLSGKPIKNATAEDCNKAFQECQQGHESIGGTASGIDLMEQAQFMSKDGYRPPVIYIGPLAGNGWLVAKLVVTMVVGSFVGFRV